MGKDKGHLIPPIWMEENKEAFDAMKAQVEREEARRSDMGVDVAHLLETMHRANADGRTESITFRPEELRVLCDLLDAKEQEVAELQRRITHSDFHRSKALRKIRGQRRNIKDMERKIERLQAAYNALLNLPVKGIEAKLRQQMQHESDKAFQRMKQLHALQAKLDAVKSAHPMVSDAGQREHCGACIKPWPCDTIKALDAD